MHWTVRYFLYQARLWEDHGIEAEYANAYGALAYASRKVVMWRYMASQADEKFICVNDLYHSVVNL